MKKIFVRQSGAATILITMIIIILISIVVMFSANYNLFQQKIMANENRNQQAYEAAEAGLEFGIVYLQQNSGTILANPVGGFVQPYTDANVTNVSLANGSKYSIVYTNPVANNYSLITVTSTGVSDDGTATRVISQQVQSASNFSKQPINSITTQGSVALSGNASISNLTNNNTIDSSFGVTFSGNANTVIKTGVSSNSSSIKSDVVQNDLTTRALSGPAFFGQNFSASEATMQSNAQYYYTNQSNYNTLLNGKTNTSIWIDPGPSGSVSLSGNTVVGSATQPVLLIINGGLSISGNATIYGLVVVLGTGTHNLADSGNSSIHGALITTDNIALSGNAGVVFDPTILTKVQQISSVGGTFAKVAGSWKDF